MDGSDEFVLERIAGAVGNLPFIGWLAGTELARSAVSVLDAASRGQIAYKILPNMQLEEPFVADRPGDAMYLSQDNYERYRAVLDALDRINAKAAVSLFTLLSPMLDQAYEEIGEPLGNTRSALKAALDHAMGMTVTEQGNIALVRPVVHYQFADPAMEKMSDVHKQLIRMGAGNATALQQKLAQIRELL